MCSVFKGEGTIARQGDGLVIDERVFHELENLLEAPMIRKDYRVYDLPEGRRLECSCVDRERRRNSIAWLCLRFTPVGRDVTAWHLARTERHSEDNA